MRQKMAFTMLLILVMLLTPIQVLAIDFEIPDVQIKARLTDEGNVNVTEQFTYTFGDDFEGITRSLIAKEGTVISDFLATENGNSLKVEEEDGFYKIYRSGKDSETIDIELTYQIEKAVEKFEDGAQFYWPFFDKSNESEYGNMTIFVLPPIPADRVEALGYDDAFNTADITENGVAIFKLGHVPDETNADIRVIFEPQLFPDVPVQDGTIRNHLAEDREKLENEAVVFAHNRQTAEKTAIPLIVMIGLGLVAMIVFAWFRTFKRKQKIRNYPYEFFVPKETMSIPALLYFTHSVFLTPAAVSAAIMELNRKGIIRQLSEERFELLKRDTDHVHETELIGLLFDQIGDGNEFTLPEVEAFTQKDTNHATYNESIIKWKKGVSDEVKSRGLYEKQPILRWTAAVMSALFSGLAIYTGVYGLFPGMAASATLVMAALSFATFYSPLTQEGLEIRHLWKQLKIAMEKLPSAQWDRLTPDDKLRAFAYFLGSDQKTAEKKSHVFQLEEIDTSTFPMNPLFITALFLSADTHTSASASSGFTGTGVDGGGGGSGAF